LLLKRLDSTIVNGTSSDDNGKFSFNSVAIGNYILKTSFIGFEDNYKNIEASNENSISAIVLIESAETLSEVSIVVKKPTLVKKADRLVFNVANTALSEGNLLDVLRSTPTVLVLDDVIKIKNSSPTVYINDRKVNLSGSEVVQLLENSPANSIKSVEVITTPGARYDADSGIVLNIVMGKNVITGYRGRVFGNYTQGVFPRYNGGISNFLKKDKISLSANYSYTKSKINRENDDEISYLNANNSLDELWKSNINRNTWSDSHNASISFDYFINDNNTLSLSSNLLLRPNLEYRIQDKTTILNASNTLLYSFIANTFSTDDKQNLGFDLDYVSKFNNHSKLSLNAHYTDYDYSRIQKVNSNYFLADNTFDFDTAFKNNSNQETNIFTSQTDFETPINENATLSFGAKGSFVETNSNLTQFDIINNQEILNTTNSNTFDYNEDVYAAYVSYNETIGDFSFRGGLRVEQTNITGKTVNENNKQDYFEWFPTVSISHQISNKVRVYTNYKRSITRPNYQSLNPFQFFINDNVIVTGNPNLQPSFINHWVIGTSLNNKHTFEAYLITTDDNVNELPIQDNNTNIITYTPTNIGKTTELGFDYITYFDLFERLSIYFVTSFYYTQEEARFNNKFIELDQWSNYFELSGSTRFLKDKSLSTSLSLVYSSKNLQGLQISKGQLFSDLAISKTIWKKRGTISLIASGLFNTQDFRTSSNYLNQKNSQFSNLDTRYIKLGFSYKFGNTTLETNERSKEKEELDRLKERG
jgi:outer membrane receptor protein involved in Fe transport